MVHHIQVDQLYSLIPSIPITSKIDRINKGYSDDLKFMITSENQDKMLLRLIDIKQYESKRDEYSHLQTLKNYGVHCPITIDFGRLPDFDACYMLLSYIEGEDASEVLSNYDEQTQYSIGLQAGKDLARIHQYRAPEGMPSWYARKVQKHKNYVEAYKQCGIIFPYEKQVLSFIEDNLQEMKHRPNLFQHDDFSCTNIIVKDNQYAGVIDFNRYDWGDPIHEFLKVGLFSREVSTPFCIGQIQGYYQNSVPDYFWRLYTLYMGMAVISSIVWNNTFYPEKNDEMLERLLRVTEEHKGFEQMKPVWFN